MRKILNSTILFLGLCCIASEDWKKASPGWRYDFPRDHHAHPDFKTEWWYFTGNLFDGQGRRFGYELTFFRQGIRSPSERDPAASRFIVNDLKFAHFTITDAGEKRFRFEQKTSRGAFGESGFDEGDRIAWLDSWSLKITADAGFDLSAESADAALRLHLKPLKSPAIHGQEGISAKASSGEHASHYYSITRLETRGELRSGNSTHSVHGESWFDHEWATNQLAAGQVGWNWLGLQFDDGTELMLYEMRLENGRVDPASSGTFIAADGTAKFLPKSSFEMKPTDFWTSKASAARYPIGWQVRIPELALEFFVASILPEQELALVPLTYWEGAMDVAGTRAGRKIKGRGYLELTGYAAPLRELIR